MTKVQTGRERIRVLAHAEQRVITSDRSLSRSSRFLKGQLGTFSSVTMATKQEVRDRHDASSPCTAELRACVTREKQKTCDMRGATL